MINYKAIRGSTYKNGILGQGGFILSEYIKANDKLLLFLIHPKSKTDFNFVFGFRGAGNYHRVEYNSKHHRFVINKIEDGITVYLQHAYLVLTQESVIKILIDDISIRIYENDTSFINLFHDNQIYGHWGFKGCKHPTQIPEVEFQIVDKAPIPWIILGDGYSNNRWKSRDFYSWPELTFGDKDNYLNACVAAGNTQRVLEIISKIGIQFKSSNVIIAAGADDIMELEDQVDIENRMLEIVQLLRSYDVNEIHFCTLVPKPRFSQQIDSLNAWIQSKLSSRCESIIDIYTVLAADPDTYLINNDIPGPSAQKKIAQCVIEKFYYGQNLSPLIDQFNIYNVEPLHKRLTQKIARSLSLRLDHFLNRF